MRSKGFQGIGEFTRSIDLDFDRIIIGRPPLSFRNLVRKGTFYGRFWIHPSGNWIR
jgi:hypothetical protein